MGHHIYSTGRRRAVARAAASTVAVTSGNMRALLNLFGATRPRRRTPTPAAAGRGMRTPRRQSSGGRRRKTPTRRARTPHRRSRESSGLGQRRREESGSGSSGMLRRRRSTTPAAAALSPAAAVAAMAASNTATSAGAGSGYGVRCNSACMSACREHGMRAGDFLRRANASPISTASPFIKRSPTPMPHRSRSAHALRSAALSSDSDALYMSSASQRSSRSFLSSMVSGVTASSRSSLSSRRRVALGVNLGSSVTGVSTTPTRVVLDGVEVSSVGDNFNVNALQAALHYYKRCSISAVALLPPTYRSHTALRLLASSGSVAFTAPGTAYQHYLVEYAMRNVADIVSNRSFRSIVAMQRGAQARHHMQAFLDIHLIPFAIVGATFVPNPDPKRIGRAVHRHRVKLPRNAPSHKLRRSRSARTV